MARPVEPVSLVTTQHDSLSNLATPAAGAGVVYIHNEIYNYSIQPTRINIML